MRQLMTAAFGAILTFVNIPAAMAEYKTYENFTPYDLGVIIFIKSPQISLMGSNVLPKNILARTIELFLYDQGTLTGVKISGKVNCEWQVSQEGDATDKMINEFTRYKIIVDPSNASRCQLVRG